VNAGVAEEPQEEKADALDEDPRGGITGADVSMSTEAREEFDRGLQETVYEDEGEEGVALDELIGALGPLRRTRRHPLLQGIRMFTAKLEEALGISFEPREREGILQIAMGAMDEAGIPDVEHGVQIALETRAELHEQMGPDPDPDDEPEVETAEEGEPSDPDAPGPDES
jgi:hypothetical protein